MSITRLNNDGLWLCVSCNTYKTVTEFTWVKAREKPKSYCRLCANLKGKKQYESTLPEIKRVRQNKQNIRRQKTPKKFAESSRDRRVRHRQMVMDHYGAECVCCGESEYVFLCIDHINGGGVQERKRIGGSGDSMMRYIIKQGYPTKYQVLCWNCNSAKHINGVCPHQIIDDPKGI